MTKLTTHFAWQNCFFLFASHFAQILLNRFCQGQNKTFFTHTHTHTQVCLRPGPVIDPDNRDTSPFPYSTDKVSNFLRTFFKGVSHTPSIFEACIFTVGIRDHLCCLLCVCKLLQNQFIIKFWYASSLKLSYYLFHRIVLTIIQLLTDFHNIQISSSGLAFQVWEIMQWWDIYYVV